LELGIATIVHRMEVAVSHWAFAGMLALAASGSSAVHGGADGGGIGGGKGGGRGSLLTHWHALNLGVARLQTHQRVSAEFPAHVVKALAGVPEKWVSLPDSDVPVSTSTSAGVFCMQPSATPNPELGTGELNVRAPAKAPVAGSAKPPFASLSSSASPDCVASSHSSAVIVTWPASSHVAKPRLGSSPIVSWITSVCVVTVHEPGLCPSMVVSIRLKATSFGSSKSEESGRSSS